MVYVVTEGEAAENVGEATLIFDTLRRGFPTAAVHVVDSGSSDAVREAIAVRTNEGRCCTNRPWPARCPPTGYSPADAV